MLLVPLFGFGAVRVVDCVCRGWTASAPFARVLPFLLVYFFLGLRRGLAVIPKSVDFNVPVSYMRCCFVPLLVFPRILVPEVWVQVQNGASGKKLGH